MKLIYIYILLCYSNAWVSLSMNPETTHALTFDKMPALPFTKQRTPNPRKKIDKSG